MMETAAELEGWEAPAETEVDVRLAGVRKTYGDVVAVDRIELEVLRGEFFTMLGPSGSGKTTCLRMIAGFERPDEGGVELAGQDVTRLPPHERDVDGLLESPKNARVYRNSRARNEIATSRAANSLIIWTMITQAKGKRERKPDGSATRRARPGASQAIPQTLDVPVHRMRLASRAPSRSCNRTSVPQVHVLPPVVPTGRAARQGRLVTRAGRAIASFLGAAFMLDCLADESWPDGVEPAPTNS
jgi:ABC-type sugar transport system ATPase subunit